MASIFNFMTLEQIADTQKVSPLLDLSDPMQRARDFIAANATRQELVFPSGIYRYSVSPNWAINDITVKNKGQVKLRYVGNGDAVIMDAGLSGWKYNITFGNFIIEGESTTHNGVYLRSIHHSNIGLNVRGCGADYAGMLIHFSVCNRYNQFTCSNNEANWYLGHSPKNGIIVDRRNVGESSTANIFDNPIIEHVSGDGITLLYADQNHFISGTSEGCGGVGIRTSAGAGNNKFNSIDLEVNAGGDVIESGLMNIYEDIFSMTSVTFNGTKGVMRGGHVANIINNGAYTDLDNVVYARLPSGGTIIDNGIKLSKRNVYNQLADTFDDDMIRGNR